MDENMNEMKRMVGSLYSKIITVIPESTEILNYYWEIGKILSILDRSNIKQTEQREILLELSKRLNGKFSWRNAFNNLLAMKCFYHDFPNGVGHGLCTNWVEYIKFKSYYIPNMNMISKNSSISKTMPLMNCHEQSAGRGKPRLYQLKNLFLIANHKFLVQEGKFIDSNVAERSICGRLMYYLQKEFDESMIKGYYVDVEYNRNGEKIKTILGHNLEVISITCDLIVHSRGEIIAQDNLLALEMKKAHSPHEGKRNDKNRLMALTKKSYDDVWTYDGIAFPEHVCGYLLGIYYEIDINRKEVLIEYYTNGTFRKKGVIKFE